MRNSLHTRSRLLWLVPVITPLVLSACDPRPQSQVDPAAFLGKLMESEGPEVDGVNATLLDSARQAEEKKQYGRAVQFYQQLLDADRENATYILGLADNLRRVGQFDEAVARYGSVLTKQPDNVDALEGKGLCLLSKGDFDGASQQFKQVMLKDGNRWRTLNAIGILFVMNEKPQEALSYYDQALKVKPDEPAVLNNAGLTLAMTQDYLHAIDALIRADSKLLDGDLQKERVDLNLALVYGLSGDMDRAESVAKRHLKDSALNNNLGFYAYLADNKELAKAYLNNALSGSPVFYEKAWKNLETVAGSRTDSSSGVMRKGKFHQSLKNQETPFSVYPVGEKQPEKAVAAPVAPVSGGQDLDALVLGDEKATPATAAPAVAAASPTPLAAAIAPAPTPVLKPAVAFEQPAPAAMPAVAPEPIGDPHVEVFPAVPVDSMMGGTIKPVAMPVTPKVDKKDELPPIMPPAAMAKATSEQKKAVEEVSDEAAKPLKASKIMEKIRAVQAKKTDEIPQEGISAVLPSEMGEGAVSPAELRPQRMRDPRSDMIIYQAKPAQDESVQQPAGTVAKETGEAASAPADATLAPAATNAASDAVPAVSTTLKPRKKEEVAAEKEPAIPPSPAASVAAEVEQSPATPEVKSGGVAAPAAAEQHPVERKSTLDAIKQIF